MGGGRSGGRRPRLALERLPVLPGTGRRGWTIPAATRAWRQRRQAEALAAHDDLRASLTTRGRVPLSSFGRLPVDAFDELLDLLATGLDAPQTEDGSRRALSIDGSVEISLWPPTDGTLVAIETDNGRFGSPDFGVSITLTDGPEILATELDGLPVEAAGADVSLAGQHAAERSRAVRELLSHPILDVGSDPDRFGLVVRHHEWLADWFETSLRLELTVDIGAGFARLSKRSARPDPTRPLRRPRGARAPFDRRRFQLLCLVCAELVRRPVTTIGLLAQALTSEAGFDTSRYGDRSSFVDALLVLGEWGVVRATAGTVEAFQNDERANAILAADTARLHRLLVSTNAPSPVGDTADPVDAIALLLAEPRYGDTPQDPGTAPRSSACGGPGTASPAASSTTRWCFWLISARLSTTTCSTRRVGPGCANGRSRPASS